MKERSLYAAVLLAAITLMAMPHGAHAQASPTPTSTPISCGGGFQCNTGAEGPEAWLGISGGNINSIGIDKSNTVTCCSGTFGALVVDASPGATPTPAYGYVLSTNHVMARTSGTGGGAHTNEEVIQPGLTDLGCWQPQNGSDTVAKLAKWTPLKYKGAANSLDAAIATVVLTPENAGSNPTMLPGLRQDGAILNIGQISNVPFPYDQITDDLAVMKMGRTTCVTTGLIDAFDVTGLVTYDGTCGAASSGTATFTHQILVFGEDLTTGNACTFADKGDSGAIVVTNDFSCPQAIGMVFAGASGVGPDSGGTIIAINPLTTDTGTGILDKYKLSLVGQTCTPSAFEKRLNGAAEAPQMTAAMRASVQQMKLIKEAHSRHVLKVRGVEAIGIGRGDTADTAALKVYLTKDTPQIRNKVLAELKGAPVKFRKIKQKFKAL